MYLFRLYQEIISLFHILIYRLLNGVFIVCFLFFVSIHFNHAENVSLFHQELSKKIPIQCSRFWKIYMSSVGARFHCFLYPVKDELLGGFLKLLKFMEHFIIRHGILSKGVFLTSVVNFPAVNIKS